MKTAQSDLARRIVPIADESEIAAIERDGAHDLVGWRDSGGHYYAYADTVRKFRRRELQSRESREHG
jgi:hypothetical protein